jgi:hypothetical protein
MATVIDRTVVGTILSNMSRFSVGTFFGALWACNASPALAIFSVCDSTKCYALVVFGFLDAERNIIGLKHAP